MAIIGEELPEYVQKQINARQRAHGSGWNDQRTQEQITYLNSKTAWIKLASGNYVSEEKLKSLGMNNQNFLGTGLAQNHILFGGFASISNSPESSTFNINQRNGFIGNEFTNNAYEIGKDFGIVPMPGILSMDVKALNRGSLKKAIVKIKVQNRDQLTIIDTLYLRLGYTVLLEWGNSIYLDNEDNLQKTQDTILENKQLFFNPEWTNKAYDDVLGHIEKYRDKYDGNYDGLLGKVSNFNWTFNPDGSYDVELTIISYGDVIESLKTNVTAQKETYDFVDAESITTHAGRTVQDHRTDNILFTLLHAFKIFGPKDRSKKVQVDGADYGWFIQQGGETTTSSLLKYTFTAIYTLNQINLKTKVSKPVKVSDFKFFKIKIDNPYNIGNSIYEKYKVLAQADQDNFEKAFWERSSTTTNNIDSPINQEQAQQFTQNQTNLLNSQLNPDPNSGFTPAPGTRTPTPGTIRWGNAQPAWTLPSPAYHIQGENYIKIDPTTYINGFNLSFDKYLQNYNHYPLKHILTTTNKKYTVTGASIGLNESNKEVDLGEAGSPEDDVFKLIHYTGGVSRTQGEDRYTVAIYPSTSILRKFSIQTPNIIWGIQTINKEFYNTEDFFYDGLETKWLQDVSGSRFNTPKFTSTETPPAYSSVPSATTTTSQFISNLTSAFYAWTSSNKVPTKLHEIPEYDANGNSTDNRYEFFHRFVAPNKEEAIKDGKEFHWSVEFKNVPGSVSNTVVKNPLYSIKPYDPRGAIMLSTNPEVYYIRFGFLLQIIQDKVTLKIDKGFNYSEYEKNTPIFKIAYEQNKFDMLCLPNQMSFDLTKCLVRRDSITRDWDPKAKPSKIFDSAHPWYHGDEPSIYASGSDLKTNVADIMNIYIDFDFVGQCMLSATDERGNMSTYNFINNICIGLNKALAGVNNLEPVIDEDTNTLYILDSSPKYDYRKEKVGEYQLQLYGYKEYKGQKEPESTFARKVDLKTAITPEYATMITIGATAGGYAKGTEATAFAKWNKGIEDRFKNDFIPGDKELATNSGDYKDDVKNSYQQMMTKIDNSLGIIKTTP